ncbi:hypothetical protein VCRA2119O48_860001 [Vibrio crassostreae]|nr:hypothetical protein VCRA2119O48_860001 [Vibrio crassostreae]CAK4028537.1 hypothetical protein VCRA212O16_930001 [Vibrio crassostreae]
MKVARWVLRGTALGNKCRLPDHYVLELILIYSLLILICPTRSYPNGGNIRMD